MGDQGSVPFLRKFQSGGWAFSLGTQMLCGTGPSTHTFAFEHFPSFILFGKFLFMFLKCVVEREEILAVSGFRETLSPFILSGRKKPGHASKTLSTKLSTEKSNK